MANSVTVTGADGTAITVNFQYADYAALASTLLGGVPGPTPPDGPGGYAASDNLVSSQTGAINLDYGAFGPSFATNADGVVVAYDPSNAAGQVILSDSSTLLNFTSTAGSGTIIAGGGSDTFSIGSGDWNILTSDSATVGGGSSILLGSGNDTVTMGGPDTIVASTGSTLVFGASTVPGGQIYATSGSLTYVAGMGSEVRIDSQRESNVLGFGNADAKIFYQGPADAVFVAGGGSETLSAAGSTGDNVFFGSGGSDAMDSITAGSGDDTILSSAGTNTLTGGSGVDVFAFVGASDTSTSTDLVNDFTSSDYIELIGASAALQSETVVSAGLELTLMDGTQITLAGVTSIDPSHIVSTNG